MIVSLIADRRVGDIVFLAHDVVAAMRLREPGTPIRWFTEPILLPRRTTRRFSTPPQPLPASLGGMLAAVRPAEHVLFAFAGALTEPVITAFDHSQRIVVVTDASVPVLRTTQRMLKFCREVGYATPRLLTAALIDERPGSTEAEAVHAALQRERLLLLPAARGVGRTAPHPAADGLADYLLRRA